MATGSSTTRRRIGYVLNAFPVVSETFVLNELRAMRRGGVDVAVLPLTRRRDALRHAGLAELPFAVDYPPPRAVRTAVAAAVGQIDMALRRPGRYLSALRHELGPAAWRALARPGRPTLRALGKRARRWLRASRIAAAARRHGVAHLHAHYAKEPLAVAELTQRLTGLPFSFAAHAKDLYTSPPGSIARRLTRARFAVACHGHGHAYLRSIAAGPEDADKVLLVRHGTDTELFHPDPLPAAAGNPPLVLAVGRLTPKKGFEELVAACALLNRSGTPLRCVILGEGRLRARLRESIVAAGLEHVVELRPFVTQQELPRWYRRATVVAAPCAVLPDGNRDGIPNVVVEALACGVPVVATPVGSVGEIVETERNGLLVPPGDARALAAAIGRLIEDPVLAARLGRQGARDAAALDFRSSATTLVERFRESTASPVARVLEREAASAWAAGGDAERAARLLGRRPRRDERVERDIAAAVTPGLEANAWRPDLARLARRRLWDEVYKGRRLARDGAPEATKARRVLDLGCGRGGLAVALAARGARVVGLDLRRRNAGVTRRRAERYGLDLPTAVGRAERLPFAAGSFDHVFCLELLEHVRDPLAVLREVRRVLAPGGSCDVTVINRWAHLDPHFHLWGLNFMPRAVARRYIALRGRDKRSWRDLQTLDEMHYFRFGRFVRTARRLGFEVVDRDAARGNSRRRWLRSLGRRLSLGFNTVTLTLVSRPRQPTRA